MVEMRRSKRLPVHLELKVSRLFKQQEIEQLEEVADITVVDVSKHGIGFKSKSQLPIGFYFNAKLELGGEDRSLYCVVQIIRKNELEDGLTFYGCQFVGMAPVLDFIFDEYEKSVEEQ
ncbi:MAG: PilZ domain-containing protein [Lachnospiraceae bacterium]|nr:PilZ domain-containing protein [Lachnospiraceae bacterium]